MPDRLRTQLHVCSKTFIIHTFIYLVFRVSKMWTKWQIYLQVTNLNFKKYIYKGEKIFTVQSYLFNILTRNLSKHVGSTPGMNYCCTLAPMKRNIYAVLLDTSHCQNTIDGWHMGWRMLSRQCFHGKHTLASHYNTFRHQRFIVGERNGKCADYFYPRTGTDVCLTLVYL